MKGSFDMVQMLMSRLTSELHRRLRINPCWDRWSSWQFGTVYVLSQRQQTNLKRQMIATQKATPSLQPAIINVSDFPKDLWNLYALWNQLIIVNRRNWLTWYVKSFLAFPRVDHSDFSLFLCMYASFAFYYNQIWNTNKTTNNWILIECPPETKIFSKRQKIHSICVEGMSWCLGANFRLSHWSSSTKRNRVSAFSRWFRSAKVNMCQLKAAFLKTQWSHPFLAFWLRSKCSIILLICFHIRHKFFSQKYLF